MSKAELTLGEKISLLIVKSRRVFFKMNFREKLLSMLFGVVLVFFWASNQFDRYNSVWDGIGKAHNDSDFQELVIENEPNVRASFEMLVSAIDIENTPSNQEVRSDIDAMARKYRFSNFDMSPTKTDYGTELLFHTISFEVKNADYNKVGDFTEELGNSLPTVSIERIIIRPQSKNSGAVDVNYILKAIEYAK